MTILPRHSTSLRAGRAPYKERLGNQVMPLMGDEGKCGLLALGCDSAEATAPALGAAVRLGNWPRHHHDAPDDRTVQGRQGQSSTGLVMQSRKLISYLVWGATEAISSIRMNMFKVGTLDSAAVSDFFLVFRGGVSSSDAHL